MEEKGRDCEGGWMEEDDTELDEEVEEENKEWEEEEEEDDAAPHGALRRLAPPHANRPQL